MPLGQFEVKSNIRNYKISFWDSKDFIADLQKIQNAIFVVDENVWRLHKDNNLSPMKTLDPIILPINEEKKTLDTVQALYDQIIVKAPKKNMTIVAIGGGILQDIVGFVASTLYRGINWIFVPTTLLAQSDSCIGAKTSLNYKKFKNLIGTFYPPTDIHIYPDFLKTQLEVDYFSGIGEIVKLHIMGGEESSNRLIQDFAKLFKRDLVPLFGAIKNSLLIKKNYIEDDEFDNGRRNLLNYGHCFGHAIESSTKYAIPHGQAITIGMILANIVSVKRGVLSIEQEKYLRGQLLAKGLSPELRAIKFNNADIINAMKYDKKRTGQGLALVILKDGYKMEKVSDLSDEEASGALNKYKELLSK